MLCRYPALSARQIDRQGQNWWLCDVPNCPNEAQVTDNEIPQGWVTTDPNRDALSGAAQFCPEHVGRVLYT